MISGYAKIQPVTQPMIQIESFNLWLLLKKHLSRLAVYRIKILLFYLNKVGMA